MGTGVAHVAGPDEDVALGLDDGEGMVAAARSHDGGGSSYGEEDFLFGPAGRHQSLWALIGKGDLTSSAVTPECEGMGVGLRGGLFQCSAVRRATQFAT